MSDELEQLKIEELKVEIETSRANAELSRKKIQIADVTAVLMEQDKAEVAEIRQADHAAFLKEKAECSEKRKADEARAQELHAINVESGNYYKKLYARWEKDDVEREARNKITDQYCIDQRDQLRRMADALEKILVGMAHIGG